MPSREETLDHPSAHPVRKIERPQQAGLLALGSSFTPDLPGINPVVHIGANSPITVAGAAPDHENNPLPASLFIPFLGTCYVAAYAAMQKKRQA
jgi:hypothetical protein